MISAELEWINMIGTWDKSGEEKKNRSRVRKKQVCKNPCMTS